MVDPTSRASWAEQGQWINDNLPSRYPEQEAVGRQAVGAAIDPAPESAAVTSGENIAVEAASETPAFDPERVRYITLGREQAQVPVVGEQHLRKFAQEFGKKDHEQQVAAAANSGEYPRWVGDRWLEKPAPTHSNAKAVREVMQKLNEVDEWRRNWPRPTGERRDIINAMQPYMMPDEGMMVLLAEKLPELAEKIRTGNLKLGTTEFPSTRIDESHGALLAEYAKVLHPGTTAGNESEQEQQAEHTSETAWPTTDPDREMVEPRLPAGTEKVIAAGVLRETINNRITPLSYSPVVGQARGRRTKQESPAPTEEGRPVLGRVIFADTSQEQDQGRVNWDDYLTTRLDDQSGMMVPKHVFRSEREVGRAMPAIIIDTLGGANGTAATITPGALRTSSWGPAERSRSEGTVLTHFVPRVRYTVPLLGQATETPVITRQLYRNHELQAPTELNASQIESVTSIIEGLAVDGLARTHQTGYEAIDPTNVVLPVPQGLVLPSLNYFMYPDFAAPKVQWQAPLSRR